MVVNQGAGTSYIGKSGGKHHQARKGTDSICLEKSAIEGEKFVGLLMGKVMILSRTQDRTKKKGDNRANISAFGRGQITDQDQ